VPLSETEAPQRAIHTRDSLLDTFGTFIAKKAREEACVRNVAWGRCSSRFAQRSS